MLAMYTFKTTNGQLCSAVARDMDRARVRAKQKAGPDWTPGAKLVSVSNKTS